MRLGDDYYSEGLYQFRLLSLKNYQTLSVKAPTSLIKGKSANITISGAKGTLSCKSSSAAAVTVSNTSKKNVFKIMAKQAGTAKLTITSAETSSYYKATKTITISVVPTGSSLKSAKNISGKKMIVVWKRNNDVSGYQVQYSLNKAFKKGNKVITEKKKTITKTTISRLAPGKTYYVRIRTYSKVGNKNYYSAWSAEKKVTVRK